MENYAFAVVDLSYLLQRNVYACSRKKDFTPGDVVQMTIQTLNKIQRDYNLGISKYIFLADKYSERYGGYIRHHILSGSYKTDRTWMTQEKLDSIKEDPNSTEEDIKKAEWDFYVNNVRSEAKRILKEELKYFGVPCIWQEGLEFDDCAYLFACLWYENPDSRKSVIITKDSDLQYSINPKVNYFRLPTGGSKPEIITYTQMYYSMPQGVIDRGVSLYHYKAVHDSLGLGHNMLQKTKKPKVSPEKAIIKILDGDYSVCDDPGLFNLQLSTFDISKFEGLSELKEKLSKDIYTIGRLGSLTEFHEFSKKYGITGISDYYYTNFIQRFDQKLFTE